MGFYVANEHQAVTEPRLRRQARKGTPLKKSCLEFFSSTRSRTGFFASQPLDTHRKKRSTPTNIASGVRYYGQRFYSPFLGRWLSKDPIGEEGGIDLYAFVGNDPIGYVDTDGNKKYPAGDQLIVTPAQPKILPGEPSPNGGSGEEYDWGDSGLVCGFDGKPRPKLDRKQFSSQAMISCVAPCTQAHEQQHVEDLLRINPNICKGKRPGDSAPFPDHYSKHESEAKAFQKEHNCLNEKIENNPCLCQDINAARIENQEKNFYNTYGHY